MAPFLYFPWSEETVHVPIPSLEHIAATNVAIALWNRTDIKTLINKCQERHLVEAKVKCYARELVLPEGVMDKVLSFTKPIGLQIFLWKDYFSCDACLPEQLFWNVFGTIDPKKTAEGFVKDYSRSLKSRYKTACTYCLEDDVINLWEQLSEESKEAFAHPIESDYETFENRLFSDDLVSLWSCAMKESGDLKKRFESLGISSDYFFLVLAVQDCIQPAVEYFLPKLTSSARRDFLLDAQGEIIDCLKLPFDSNGHESFFWLLLRMEEDYGASVLAKNAVWVLMWCLDWPSQDLFLPAANRLMPFLSCSHVSGLLDNIITKVRHGYRDYDYQQLFTTFWELCPETAKRYIMKELVTDCDLLTALFSVGDKKNVQLILKDATDEELENIISYHRKFCLDSQQDILQNEHSRIAAKTRWTCLFLLEFFVDDEFNKRKIEGNPSKKFRAAKDCYHQHILTKFWDLCPEIAQRHIMKEFATNCDLLMDLFSVGDKKSVQRILKDATDEELGNIISYYRKNCMASLHDPPKNKFPNDDARMKWMILLLLEFLIDEEFNRRKIYCNLF